MREPARGQRHAASTPNLASTMGIATGLVVVNIALMLLLSYTPVADLGLAVFSNFFVGIAAFAVTVGGGYWLSSRALADGNVPLAGVGVSVTQFGYALFGAALLSLVGSGLRVPALGITAVLTAAVTAVVTLAVYRLDHSFARWNYYAAGLFVVGLLVGAVGFLVAPSLLLLASVCFLLGFVAQLAHEIWEVKRSEYAGTLLNAIGIYVAVMGVFVSILQWVVRLLAVLEE